MLNRLNNTNGKGSNAVVNKQIKDLQDAVTQLRTDVDQQETDIASIDSALDNKVSKAEQAAEVDTASLKAGNAKIDFIESKDEDDVSINDNLNVHGNVSANEASFTKVNVNGVDIVDDLNSKVSCARTDAANAVCTANDALSCACNVQTCLDAYKTAQALQTNTVEANIGCARVSCSVETPALTVTSCAEIIDLTSQTIKAKAELMDAFVEPTEKDPTDFYLFLLPPKFQGRVHLVAYDTNDDVAFSATIDTSFSDRVSSALGDREGTGILIHSGVTKWDFYQLLRRKDQDRLAFITQANVKKLYYKYDNFDKTEEPIYEIYPNLTDEGPDYTLYDTIYTAEHSDQVVIYGSEETLNGGLTVFGTFYATAFEIPETEVTNVRVKHQIYGGYDCDVGEYTTCGTRGGLITYSDCPGLPEEVVTWINGCPRQVVRKGVCECVDGYGKECSQLCFEDVKTVDSVTCKFIPDQTDSLFDEKALAGYEGETTLTGVDQYPIKHLNCNTCVHGCIEVLDNAIVCSKVITNCIESDTGCHLGLLAKANLLLSSVCDTCVSAVNYTEDITGDKSSNICGGVTTIIVCDRNTVISGNDTERITGQKTFNLNDDFNVNSCSANINSCEFTNINSCCGTVVNAPETIICCKTCIDELHVKCVAGDLTANGDIRANQLIADNDVVVHGDLYVEGTTTTTSESQVTSTGDFIVVRENNPAAMASNTYAGLVVNNYDGNGSMSTITSDEHGEWRVSDSSSATSTTYTDISNYKGNWYDHLTQTTVTGPSGILSNVSALELASTVYNTTAGTETVVGYYHKSGSDWFGPVTVVNGKFDLGSLVSDATDIAALNVLTASDLVYYNTVTDTQIDNTTNEPLMTRDEAANMSDGNPMVWDATDRKAVAIAPNHRYQTIYANASCKSAFGVNSCVFPVYDTCSQAVADLPNLEVGTLVATKTNEAVIEENFTVGVVLEVAGSCIPTDFCATNGAAISRTGYPVLFSRIGTTFGPGDGTTTFNLPNVSSTVSGFTKIIRVK